jgi:hypothetical protein
MLTLEDDDRQEMPSSHWPQKLGNYSREKKLIRDVSGKSETYRSRFSPASQN